MPTAPAPIDPVILRGDAFTSPQRTPWGGTNLARHFKQRWTSGEARTIGESWEISLGPELPSRSRDTGIELAAMISDAPEAWLGVTGARAAGLLVKLLDAAEPLSLQIHPSDDYVGLRAGEGGKPESWYVVAHEPDAWIAFGWREGVGRAEVLGSLARRDGSLAGLLQRVKVAVGDCFVVDAGTPHAIGPGVTLVEPQYVGRERRGVTYRYWDWERRYDACGLPDPLGSLRELHVDDALAVTDWDHAKGSVLLQRARCRAGVPALEASIRLETLAGRGGRIDSEWLRVERLAGTGSLAWPALHPSDEDTRVSEAALSALTIVGGSGRFLDRSGAPLVSFGVGDTLAIPAHSTIATVEGTALHAIRSSIEPFRERRSNDNHGTPPELA